MHTQAFSLGFKMAGFQPFDDGQLSCHEFELNRCSAFSNVATRLSALDEFFEGGEALF